MVRCGQISLRIGQVRKVEIGDVKYSDRCFPIAAKSVSMVLIRAHPLL